MTMRASDPGSATATVSVVVIDDEELARRRIAQLLAKEPDMTIVAECSDGLEAIETVERLKPDLLFLDVQMPGIDGFGVLSKLTVDPLPEAVFVTAFDEHAIRAFEVNALDYLLKPIDVDRFRIALDRVRERVGRPAGGAPFVSRFLVRTGTKTVVVRACDVDRVEADGNYVRLHVESRSYLVRETMNRLEQSLDPSMFVRIHRSAMVNMSRVREVEPHLGHDYLVRLSNGVSVRMSRWYHEEFERRMRHGAG
jgi:two-component system LytT family response regulator